MLWLAAELESTGSALPMLFAVTGHAALLVELGAVGIVQNSL